MFVGCHCTPITRFSCPGAAEVFPHHSVGCSQGTGSWTCSGFSAQGQVQGEEWVQGLLLTARVGEGSVPFWGCCVMATLQSSYLLPVATELVAPERPCPCGWCLLGTHFGSASHTTAPEARPRISVLYPHPGHGAELCQVSNTATFQFPLAP